MVLLVGKFLRRCTHLCPCPYAVKGVVTVESHVGNSFFVEEEETTTGNHLLKHAAMVVEIRRIVLLQRQRRW
ncbi:hypothetical protein GOP47_0014896 [Adiantum capillus-veneris]|uniref:Uncharacterized protein n=1 Tax=Adiantum capillus-veneris TaxID=13818 RepID=A0A9D4ZCL2_ADICA|nr:hypothetical protein GOP47_0014896 [Adiantum capillus-veneris]